MTGSEPSVTARCSPAWDALALLGLGFVLPAQQRGSLRGCGDSGPRGTSVVKLHATRALL